MGKRKAQSADWEIIIDKYEFKVYPYLKELAPAAGVAYNWKPKGQSLDGDFIIMHKGVPVMAFERKATLDAWNSITSGRLDDQISRLAPLFPHVGIIYEEYGYTPKSLRRMRLIIKQAVLTKMSELSFRIPVLHTMSPRHTAYMLLRIITEHYLDELIEPTQPSEAQAGSKP